MQFCIEKRDNIKVMKRKEKSYFSLSSTVQIKPNCEITLNIRSALCNPILDHELIPSFHQYNPVFVFVVFHSRIFAEWQYYKDESPHGSLKCYRSAS